MTIAAVEARLKSNIERVESLVMLFGEVASEGSSTKTDLLRASVVFLHATLEDVVRAALELKLPHVKDTKHLDMLLFTVGGVPKPKISVSELAKHRGMTIEQLIGERIDAYLERSNFNNMAELDGALRRMELDTSILDPYKDLLVTMMTRRHWIVHRADRDESAAGGGRNRTRQISVSAVEGWKNAVEGFCSKLLDILAQS